MDLTSHMGYPWAREVQGACSCFLSQGRRSLSCVWRDQQRFIFSSGELEIAVSKHVWKQNSGYVDRQQSRLAWQVSNKRNGPRVRKIMWMGISGGECENRHRNSSSFQKSNNKHLRASKPEARDWRCSAKIRKYQDYSGGPKLGKQRRPK